MSPSIKKTKTSLKTPPSFSSSISRQKRFKKEISFFKRLIILVGFRQTYFFLKNCLGMVVHPQLTTAKILGKKDFSQAFLVFGLPFGLWLLLVGFSFLFWLLSKPTGFFFSLGIAFFLITGFFLMAIALYDLYWVIKYLKKINKIT